jgi:RimJ/RimL family protein N-acetyltransferase
MDVDRDTTMTGHAVTRSRVCLGARDGPAERVVGPRPGCAVRGKRVVLRDGSQVLIRQLQPSDAPLLADGFARLSAESRRLRFLIAKTELSAAEVRYFTEIDHHDHEALGALHHLDGCGLGTARYVRCAEDPEAAEIAVTVLDDWQRRGLGTELLTQLTDRARQEGIRRFTALAAAENVAVVRLLRSIGTGVRVTGRGGGTIDYEIILPRRGLSGDLHALLGAFGWRQLKLPNSIRDALAGLIPGSVRSRR